LEEERVLGKRVNMWVSIRILSSMNVMTSSVGRIQNLTAERKDEAKLSSDWLAEPRKQGTRLPGWSTIEMDQTTNPGFRYDMAHLHRFAPRMLQLVRPCSPAEGPDTTTSENANKKPEDSNIL
jgi:hypothetical protein